MLTNCDRTRLLSRRPAPDQKACERFGLDSHPQTQQCCNCDQPAALLVVKYDGPVIKLVCRECADKL